MIAKYYRLSLADGDLGKDNKDESNSIVNQRLLIENYLARCEEFHGRQSREYIDDGYTGTNFERPGFESMMNDVRSGNIDTVIVKDMSRFGRDYILVGDYLEQIFPVLGVRFIAVNNNYDSNKNRNTTLSLDMTIGNLVNSMYSKDISKKVRTAKQSRWRQGYHTNGTAPFGYKLNPKIKGRYSIDQEAAQIVRRIFQMALEGKSTGQIAFMLNEDGIPTPSEYGRHHQVKGKRNYHRTADVVLWNSNRVREILRNYEYTGALILGKSQIIITGSDVSRRLPENEQIIHEGVNEAIVTKEEFEQASSVIRKKKRGSYHTKYDYCLKGKIRCGACGRLMSVNLRGARKKVSCKYGRQMEKYSNESTKKYCNCSPQIYQLEAIEEVAKRSIYSYCYFLDDLSEKMKKRAEKESINQTVKESEIKELKDKINHLNKKKMRLYESYASGSVPLDCYKKRRDDLDTELLSMATRLEHLKNVEETEPFPATVCTYIEEATAMTGEIIESDGETLTRQVVDKMIEAVYVYDKNHMEVRFRFSDAIKEVAEQVSRG